MASGWFTEILKGYTFSQMKIFHAYLSLIRRRTSLSKRTGEPASPTSVSRPFNSHRCWGIPQLTLIPLSAARASQTSLISNDTLMSFTSGGTLQWMSPELLDPELFGQSKATDQQDSPIAMLSGWSSTKYVFAGVHLLLRVLTDDTLGLMRTPPLRRYPVISSNRHVRSQGEFDRRNLRGRSAWGSVTSCGGPLNYAGWKIGTRGQA
jgi:hypothetical protein